MKLDQVSRTSRISLNSRDFFLAALFTIFCVTRALLKSALLRVIWKGFLCIIDNRYILVYLTKAFVPLLSYSTTLCILCKLFVLLRLKDKCSTFIEHVKTNLPSQNFHGNNFSFKIIFAICYV